MPVPTPDGGETESQFMSRCVPELMDAGHEQDQSVAICLKQWRGEGATMAPNATFAAKVVARDGKFCVVDDDPDTEDVCYDTQAEADAAVSNKPMGGKKAPPFGKKEAARTALADTPKITEQDGKFCCEHDGKTECFDTRAEAEDALAKAMGPDGGYVKATGRPFHVFITVEGLETHDGRLFERGGLEPRATLPIPLMVQERAEHGGMMGDTTAWFAGSIDEVFRDPRDDTRWMGKGHLMAGDAGKRAEELIDGGLKFVSVDASADDVTLDIRAVDDTGQPINALYRYSQGRIMGATITPFPAFEQCTIWFDGEAEPEIVAATHGGDVAITESPEVVESPLLLASGGPNRPPAAWFENPKLTGETPLTVDQDGRVFGHIATWNTCHIGTADTCITAPTSPSNYAYFHTGEVVCAGGERIPVGTLTLGTGHAHIRDSAKAAMGHYDNTGTGAVDMRCGDDDYGIWCAGAVRPHLSERDIRTLMAAAPSGDWRRINGYLELVAVLAVNVPGFPVPRTQARVASGAEQALVAAPGPGIMTWQDRFAATAGHTREAFMATLRKMISDMVEAALNSSEVAQEVAEEIHAADVRTAEEKRARHIVAPPLNPDADPKRTALNRRKREIKAAQRNHPSNGIFIEDVKTENGQTGEIVLTSTTQAFKGNLKVGKTTVQEAIAELDEIVATKPKPKARRARRAE